MFQKMRASWKLKISCAMGIVVFGSLLFFRCSGGGSSHPVLTKIEAFFENERYAIALLHYLNHEYQNGPFPFSETLTFDLDQLEFGHSRIFLNGNFDYLVEFDDDAYDGLDPYVNFFWPDSALSFGTQVYSDLGSVFINGTEYRPTLGVDPFGNALYDLRFFVAQPSGLYSGLGLQLDLVQTTQSPGLDEGDILHNGQLCGSYWIQYSSAQATTYYQLTCL